MEMIFGYAYPAYECYKTVEKNKPEIEQLRFWCQYWILVAVLTGTTYVYDSFFRPYVAKHENEIDRNLLELRTRAGDMAVLYWQRAASYGQTRIFEILQYVAAQSTPRPRPTQPQQGVRARQPATATNRQSSNTSNRQPAVAQPENEEPPSPTSSTSSSQHHTDVAEEVREAPVPPAAASNALKAPAGASSVQKVDAGPETSSQPSSTKAEVMQIEAAPSSTNENENPPPKETNMDEAIRVTRARLRKSRSGPKS
ncbi:conserved hypothetical protein [Ricinus communis]|uniref:HVA22-like protein n=1 Tax=Ricinus communis TaxID=3988 RepID=B9R877_RICCO|nr:conserved hypothetical protein [Ricinus communis]